MRGPLYAATDLEDNAALGFQIIRADDYQTDGVKGAVNRMRRRQGDGPVYVSVDIDVLDPAHVAYELLSVLAKNRVDAG